MLAAALWFSSSLVAADPVPPTSPSINEPPATTLPAETPPPTPTTTTTEPLPELAALPSTAEWSLGAGIGTTNANVGLERKLGPTLWLVADVAASAFSSNTTRPDPENDGESIETKRDTAVFSAAFDVGVRYYFVQDAPVRPSLHITGGPFLTRSTTTIENTVFFDDDLDSNDTDILDHTLGLGVTGGGAVDVPFFDGLLAVRVAADVVRASAALVYNEFDVDDAQKTDRTDLAANIVLNPSIEIRVYF